MNTYDKVEECVVTFEQFERKNYGSKFNNLAELNKFGINVPTAICISAEFLNKEVESYINDIDAFRKYFKEIESTAGCYLLDTHPKIFEIIKGFRISDKGKHIISENIKRYFPDFNHIKFAVRSSAAHEDSSHSSFAGIYCTSLNVNGIENIILMLEKAIVEYYSYSALIARVRSRIFSEKVELNIIVQKMIQSKISGVAFSSSPVSNGDVLIEWIYGIGELLVSGENEANTYYIGCESNENIQLMNKVVETVNIIKNHFGFEVDVEWCYDGDTLYIVQARPITDDYSNNVSKADIFEIDRLYFDTNLEFKKRLLKCEKVYYNYTSKRSSKYVLAKSNNVNLGKGYVLHFNYRGLINNIDAIKKMCEGDYFEKFDIDVDDTIRQNIIDKNQLVQYMKTVFGGYDENVEHTMIIREFISGQFGCISHYLKNGSVFIEYSKEGLLAMNRGLAHTDSIVYSNDEEVSCELSRKCIDDITRFTKKLNDNYMIEWVICNGEAYFIDYSEEIEGGICEITNKGNKVITPGNFSGKVFCLNNDDVMQKLSTSPGVSVNDVNEVLLQNVDLAEIIDSIKELPEKPVLFAKNPYAILSFLFEYVEGFVFENGSLLCHLSILLREHKIPALISTDYSKYAENGCEVLVVNGQIQKVD